MSRQDLAADALRLWGHTAQIDMMIEECGELIVALQHFKRGRATNIEVASEIADVTLMLDQAALMFDRVLVGEQITEKVKRLFVRLETAERQRHDNARRRAIPEH
jgi:NTP pyrophosphatase (non-canonical NTP hydrolase)